jgi:hypothetical protein
MYPIGTQCPCQRIDIRYPIMELEYFQLVLSLVEKAMTFSPHFSIVGALQPSQP